MFVLFASFLILTAKVSPQDLKKGTATATKETSAFADFSFTISISEDKTSTISADLEDRFANHSPGEINKLLTRYYSLQLPDPSRKPLGPRVTIDPDPSLDLKTVLVIIKAARVSPTAEIKIKMSLVDFSGELVIPAESGGSGGRNLKPNPLLLMVGLDGGKNLQLNKEKIGTLADPGAVTNKLKEIFASRAEKGVFREGTFDVEKTVTVKVPLSTKFADIGKIAAAIDASESDRMVLMVEDLEP